MIKRKKVRKRFSVIKLITRIILVLGIAVTLLYNTNYDRLFRDVRRIDKLKKRIYTEVKYQYIKHKVSDWAAEFACLFQDRLN